MSEAELVEAFTAGRLTRRAFVRQLVARGMPMGDALAYADQLVPQPAAPTPTASTDAPAVPAPPRPVQAQGLEISFVGDGYVVLQPDKERMHSLNHTAALVLELCTGEHDNAEIARLLQNAFGLTAPPLAETQSCLDTLFREGLIV